VPMVRRKMKSISLLLPEWYIKGLDQLVEKRLYLSRNDAIRAAIHDLLANEYWPKRKKPAAEMLKVPTKMRETTYQLKRKHHLEGI